MRGRLLFIMPAVGLALLSIGGAAQEPNVVFFDNFDTAPNSAWEPVIGNWSVTKGQYTVNKDVEGGKFFGAFVNLQSPLPRYTIETDINFGATGRSGIYGGQGQVEAYIFVKAQDIDNGIVLTLAGRAAEIEAARWRVRQKGDWVSETQSVNVKIKAGEIAHVRVEIQGSAYRAYLNGGEVTSFSDSSFANATKIGVGLWYQSWNFVEGKSTTFDNFKVESTEAKTSMLPPDTSAKGSTTLSALEARVAALEAQISKLQASLEALRVTQPGKPTPSPSPSDIPPELGQRVERLEKLVEESNLRIQSAEGSANLALLVSAGAAALMLLLVIGMMGSY